MGVIADELREELTDVEFSEGYAESFLDSYIATQIKVLREDRGLTQCQLAVLAETSQTAISRVENVNYSGWTIGTLKKLARAFEVRLKVSFEEYGTLPIEVEGFSHQLLTRVPRSKDLRLFSSAFPANPFEGSRAHADWPMNSAANCFDVGLNNGDGPSDRDLFPRSQPQLSGSNCMAFPAGQSGLRLKDVA